MVQSVVAKKWFVLRAGLRSRVKVESTIKFQGKRMYQVNGAGAQEKGVRCVKRKCDGL